MKRSSSRVIFYRFPSMVFILLGLVSICISAQSKPTSFRQPHPLNWLYQVPVGEAPGWSAPSWVNFELSHANIWNAPHTMSDNKTGDVYEYMADFEQTTAILEIGQEISKSWAVSLEVPYAYRDGGYLDHFIDAFHVFLGNRRFNRHFYPKYQNIYSVKTNGDDYYEDVDPVRGIHHLKPKLKWWFWRWEGDGRGSCPCGMALSGQLKVPVVSGKTGFSTGKVDPSILFHLGIPIATSSAMWFTAAYTKLSENPAMPDWPLLRDHQMYELSFDISLTDSWGLILQGRMHSPYLDVNRLTYEDPSDDPKIISRNRASSGWNSLVRWQGANAAGLRYRFKEGNQAQLLIAEDWGLGPYDADDNIYSNGAPDVNFIFQTQFLF